MGVGVDCLWGGIVGGRVGISYCNFQGVNLSIDLGSILGLREESRI